VSLSPDDIRVAAELALPHRLRRQPFVDVQIDEAQLGSIIQREAERRDGTGQEKKKS
jgi:magnesium chelatase subunit D